MAMIGSRAIDDVADLNSPIGKPDMPETYVPVIAKAAKRVARGPFSPGVSVDKIGDKYRLGSPHNNEPGWRVQLEAALGTASKSTVDFFLQQMTTLCARIWDDEMEGTVPNEAELNAILAIVTSVKPKNEMQACLALQMIAVHLMTMKLAARALQLGEFSNPDAALAGKLARTFAMQCETLNKLKGKTVSQNINVRQDRHVHNHQHIHVDGGDGKSPNQPEGPDPTCINDIEQPKRALRAPAGPDAGGTTLPGQDPASDPLPVACNEGQEALPGARRGEGQRRTQGQA